MSGPDVRGSDAGRSDAIGADAALAVEARAPATRVLREFRRPRLWLALWALMIMTVVAGSLLPARELPPVPFDGFDKFQHLFGYAVLSAYATMLFARMRARAMAAAGLVLLGIGLEVAQGLLTASRQADIADAMVNSLGVLGGLSIAATPLARLLQRLDARWR